MKRLIFLTTVMLILAAAAVSAQNDPGHDPLYVEEQGDSELNGTFNVTQNQSIKGGELGITNQLIMRGDATTADGNLHYIIANSGSSLDINSVPTGTKVLKLQDQASNGFVQIGEPGSVSVDLNVSNNVNVFGNTFSMGSNFELKNDGSTPTSNKNSIVVNGTSSRSMWFASDEFILGKGAGAGTVYVGHSGDNDIFDLNVSGVAYVNGSQVCTSDNGLCAGGGGSTAAGWTNTSTTVSLADSADDVDMNFIYVDNVNNRLRVNTSTASHALTVDGGGNFTGNLFAGGAQVCTETNGLCATSSGNSTEEMQDAVLNAGQDGNGLTYTYDDAGNTFDFAIATDGVGDNEINYSQSTLTDFTNDAGFTVINTSNNGYIKFTGDVNTTGGDICIEGGNCLSEAGTGSGDITAVGSETSGDAFADSTADDQWLGLGASSGRIEFDDQATDEVNILGAFLGIRTATPGSALDVNGSANFQQNITVSGGGISDSGGTNRIQFRNNEITIRLG